MDPKGGQCITRPTFWWIANPGQTCRDLSLSRSSIQVQELLSIVAPRRLAKRATKQVVDFEANLLNARTAPSIVGNIGDRLKQFDRSSLVALLSQREDITEEANQIADQIESYRNSIVEQLQKVQQSITSAIDGILTHCNYLNSLERPNSTQKASSKTSRNCF